MYRSITAARLCLPSVNRAYIRFFTQHVRIPLTKPTTCSGLNLGLSNPTTIPTWSLHSTHRCYASKKSSKKQSVKNNGSDVEADTQDIDSSSEPAFQMDKYEQLMQNAVEKLRKDLGLIRMGRANPALLDSVRVKYQGKSVALVDVAQITVKDAHTLVIVVSDEQLVSVVEKAVRDANLGLNPQSLPPSSLKVPVPRMAKEFRETIIKNIGRIAEACRVRIRSARADARTALKRTSLKPNSDQSRMLEKDIQQLTDKYIKDTDAAVLAKEKEIV
ncbi:hypothetical protein O5D80_000803 [Batrachochytrium dendrobatidis]|nr:hypothetical protein O5D80_000803 [Batrachochytrium dendrobatidis]